ncbi:MAG: PaaI family thioesterase [Terriglobales bacterium]
MAPKSGPVHGHTQQQHLQMARNYCFACGKDNPEGMHLKFTLDEASRSFVARLRLPQRFQGPPGHAHGGIIATVLDEAMGKVSRLRSVVALTSEMRVEYLRPVPLGTPLIVEGREVRKRGRRLVHAAELRNQQGQVLARSVGTFVVVDPEKMFARHLRKDRRR